MKKRKTTEEFQEEIQELSNGLFELRGEYIKKGEKVNIFCNKCKTEFSEIPSVILQDLKCKNCHTQVDLFERYNINNIDDYKNYISTVTNEYDVLDKNLDKLGKIKVLHKKCGIEQYVNTKKFVHNQLCKYCDGGSNVDFYGFCKKVFDKWKDEYVVINREKNDFDFVHTKCKTHFTMKSNLFLKNDNPCPVCGKNSDWNLKRCKKEIIEKTEGEFICVDTEYKNVDEPLLIKHNICGEEFSLSINSFLKTPKCPICEKNISLGEKYTGKAVNNLGFKFERQYRYEDCKNINMLKFDLAVKDNLDKVICLIEYDGINHYAPLYDNNNIDLLMDNKKKDKIKDEYCKENNIILIRVPFWEMDDIEKYLRKEMIKFGLIEKKHRK